MCTYSNPPHPMYHISVQEFKEYVRLSHSWSELARRCGQPTKFGRCCSDRVMKALKQKALFLQLDTQHFGKCARASAAGEAGEVEAVTEAEANEASEVEAEASEADAADEAGEGGRGEKGGRGGEIDELTCRLISLHNTVIDEGQLRVVHGCVRGHTLEELETYVRLWRHMGHTLEGLEAYVELWRRAVDEREDSVGTCG